MKKSIGNFLFILICCGFLLNAKVKISKIDYVPGDDFVRLFLQTRQIMPIPDVFYPEKGNLLKLVMRIKDVEIKADPKSLTFHSPVIKELNVKNGADFADVEIGLNAEVNYRVFTNEDGLFIEFPVIKEISAKTEKPRPENPVIALQNQPKAAPRPAENISRPLFQNVKVGEKQAGRVQVELLFTGKPEFTAIPIKETPARLAIDLKNIQAKRLFHDIRQLNVKSVRGSYNSPSVFRVVFDLDYLHGYAIRPQENGLLVEFFEPSPAGNETPAAVNAAPVVASQPKPAAVKPETPAKTDPSAGLPAAAENKPVESPPPTMTLREIRDIAKPTAGKKEFFGKEKAPAAGGYLTMADDKGNKQTTFVRQTVEEGRSQYSGEPYDFNFKNMDLLNVLKAIAQLAGLNIAVDPDVSGKVTCDFVQVPWDQALDLFLKINGLDMIQDGNIIRIGKVEKLAQEAEKRRQLREAREQEGKLEVFTRTLSYAKVSGVKPILEKQLSPRGEIIPDERTNTLIISEVPERIKVLDKLIDTLDAANPQVSIEARIVEATSNFLNTFGIQWGYNLISNAAQGNQTNLVFPNSVQGAGILPSGTKPNQYTPPITGAVPAGYAINLPVADSTIYPFVRLGNIANTFNLDVALSAMERKGKGRLISAPKATTQNNMEASITQGERIPILTIQNNTVTTQYVNAALELKVTPQITARGSVIMEIDIKNDIANFDKQVLGIPTITTETAKTTVMVNDGGTIVIGGLYKVSQTSSSDGVPLLGKIPLLGSLFRNSRKIGSQNELLIFITPRIIK